jgi:hypothetical protein
MVMRLTFKNANKAEIKVYLEPSTDVVVLYPGDKLELEPMYEGNFDFETHIDSDRVVVWIPVHQSVILYKNGEKIFSFCEDFLW